MFCFYAKCNFLTWNEIHQKKTKKNCAHSLIVARSWPIRLRLVLLIFDHPIHIRQFVGISSNDDTVVEFCSYQFVSQAEHLCRGTVFKALLVSLCPKA